MGEHEIEAPERVIDRGPTKQPGWSETALGWVASVLMVVVGGYFTLQTIGFCLTRAFEEGSWRAAGLLVALGFFGCIGL